MDLFGITISTDDISKEQIAIANNYSLNITLWKTHTKDRNLDAINKNPDFIQTYEGEYLVNSLSIKIYPQVIGCFKDSHDIILIPYLHS